MQRAGIIANTMRPSAVRGSRDLTEFLLSRRIAVELDPDLGPALSDLAPTGDGAFDGCDLVVAVGGDGTLIVAAHRLAGRDTPVLGVHAGGEGSFGFLTETTPERALEAMEAVLAGRCRRESRLLASAQIRRGTEDLALQVALNDFVIRAQSRLVRLRVAVDGTQIADFAGDGIIVSTPSGSTAYNLAAGGPLVYPGLDALLITPICSHTLNVRTLVVHPDQVVETELRSGERDETWLTVDGQINIPLQTGDQIAFRKSQHRAHFITLDGSSFYRKVQRRFRLGERF